MAKKTTTRKVRTARTAVKKRVVPARRPSTKRASAARKNPGYIITAKPWIATSGLPFSDRVMRAFKAKNIAGAKKLAQRLANKTGKKQFVFSVGDGRELFNATPAKTNAGKAGRRRNPDDAAADRYEYFHGREPETVTDVETPVKRHSTLSGIGKLVKIRIKNGRYNVLLGFKGTLLAQNEKGTQLFFSGGDQSVNLEDFGIKAPHENEFLGAMTDVWYHTVKDHLGDDGGDAIYHHHFSKRAGGFPIIVYDVRNKLLHVVGGGYTIPAEGIDG